MSADAHALAEQRRGLAITAGTFVLWGVVPVYWHLLREVPSAQIIAHRIIWSTLLVVAWLLFSSGLGWLRAIAAQPRALWMLALSRTWPLTHRRRGIPSKGRPAAKVSSHWGDAAKRLRGD